METNAAANAADATAQVEKLRSELNEQWAAELQERVAQAQLDAREESAREVAAAAARLEHVKAELDSTRRARNQVIARLEDVEAELRRTRLLVAGAFFAWVAAVLIYFAVRSA